MWTFYFVHSLPPLEILYTIYLDNCLLHSKMSLNERGFCDEKII